ncbi:MAG TPA: molybdopterin-binding protein [Hyphomicrobium sp.]|uniref:competence/damage-inducible protein A n=1 Tax=Hyphomicrobium sp. TaxID=82 RepID=UPI002B5DCFF8|nr:molybdopterin-binding protein [Hyphomicrobium sp.]HXE02200.1 molybdopterin-binding protein [Hyphomicrobium sp.]
MGEGRIVTAALLVIGDEILSGRTKDRNTGTIAEHLTDIGIRLKEVRVVADDEGEIVAAVNALRSRYDYVFTTGGIGPTHDDITADSIAKAFGVAIGVDPRAEKLLSEHYARRQVELTPARLRMARIPDGALLIPNAISGAPGFRIANVIVMAGVPDIMRAMLEAVTPELDTGVKLLSVTIRVERPESEIADVFLAHQRRYRDVAMGSYPSIRNGHFESELVLRGSDPARLAEAAETLKAALKL